MSTPAQRAANRANSQKSSGPKTSTGKEIASQNRRSHGLSGGFYLLRDEDPEDFRRIYEQFKHQHQPANDGEKLLVLKLAEHYWLSQRALYLQSKELFDGLTEQGEKRLALYLRYQTTNDRAFSRFLNDLLKLQKERRKAEIGSESQTARAAATEAQQARHAAAENRKNELHRYKILTAELQCEFAKKKLDADPSLRKAIQRQILTQKAA